MHWYETLSYSTPIKNPHSVTALQEVCPFCDTEESVVQRDDRSVSSSKACDATDQLVCLIVAASQLEFVLGQV